MFVMPLSHSHRSQRAVERLFDSSFDRFLDGVRANAPRPPAVDVIETEAAFVLSADLPGVERADIKVSIDGKRVAIEAAPKAVAAEEGSRTLLSERSSTAFARRLSLPVELDEQQSSARFENGVLQLTLVKKARPTATQLPVS
jgi:HSP20 family protein